MNCFFCENIKFIRNNLELSQKDFGVLLSKGERTIQAYELGLRTPPLDKLFEIAIVLKVSPKDLIFTDLSKN